MTKILHTLFQQDFQVSIISVAKGDFMLRHRFCLLFFLVLQHKLICRNILPVLFFNFLSRLKMPCHDKISAFFLFLVSRHELLSHDWFLLVLTSSIINLVATLFLFVSIDLLHASHVLSRHTVFFRDIALLYSVLCVATEERLS